MTALPWPLGVPVLTDGVVTLRAHTRADLQDAYEMAVDPAMRRWTTVPLDNTMQDTEDFVLGHVPRGWDDGTARGWAIEALDGDRPRFALHPWARGRGIMARAVNLGVEWAFTEGGVEVVHWRANLGNEASVRVAHATGFALHDVQPGILVERGTVRDAWAGTRRFGDAPLPRTRWAEATPLEGTARDGSPVRLRALREDDEQRIVEACSDPVSQHWLANLPRPYTLADARAYVQRTIWVAAKGQTATWGVADADDVLLGTVAVMDMAGLDPTSGEVGYWTHPDARGRGVMGEAVRLVVQHALDPDGLDRRRLLLYASEGNDASSRIALANGFTRFGTQHAAEPLGDGTHADLHGYELFR